MKSFRVLFLFAIYLIGSLSAYDPDEQKNKNELPQELKDIRPEIKLGTEINQNLIFKKEDRGEVNLKTLFSEGKPVLLSLVYFKCPTLCNYHLNGLSRVTKQMDWSIGNEYNIITISFDPSETPEIATKKREAYVKDYEKSRKEKWNPNGWHFLTGDEKEIQELAKSLGFKYKWNPENRQWIHPSIVYLFTPDGKLSRYFHGIEFGETELRLSLVEASGGKIGNFIDRFALFCFQFDPNKNKYTLYALNLMRIGGAITLAFLGTLLIGFWRKQFLIKKSVTGE